MAQGVMYRPMRMMAAHLEVQERRNFAAAYANEMLWALNHAICGGEWGYPHYLDMLEGETGEDAAQKKSDEKTKKRVYDWLMGGDADELV